MASRASDTEFLATNTPTSEAPDTNSSDINSSETDTPAPDSPNLDAPDANSSDTNSSDTNTPAPDPSSTDPPTTDPLDTNSLPVNTLATNSPAQREFTDQEKLLRLLITRFFGVWESYEEGGDSSSREARSFHGAMCKCLSELHTHNFINDEQVVGLLCRSSLVNIGYIYNVTERFWISRFMKDLFTIGTMLTTVINDTANETAENVNGTISTLIREFLVVNLHGYHKDRRIKKSLDTTRDVFTYFETILECRNLIINERRTPLGELPHQTRVRWTNFISGIEIGMTSMIRGLLLAMVGIDMDDPPQSAQVANIDLLCARVQLDFEKMNIESLLRLL